MLSMIISRQILGRETFDACGLKYQEVTWIFFAWHIETHYGPLKLQGLALESLHKLLSVRIYIYYWLDTTLNSRVTLPTIVGVQTRMFVYLCNPLYGLNILNLHIGLIKIYSSISGNAWGDPWNILKYINSYAHVQQAGQYGSKLVSLQTSFGISIRASPSFFPIQTTTSSSLKPCFKKNATIIICSQKPSNKKDGKPTPLSFF